MPVVLTRNMAITSAEINGLRASSWEGVQGGAWEQVLARSLGWVCATDDAALVGFVNVAWDGDVHAFLLDTTVHPAYQRQGVGTALVREAIALAREGGAEWLHVDHEEHLTPFYRACGFEPTAGGLVRLAGPA